MTVFKRNVHLGTKDPLIETDDVADKTVTTEKIADGAVTAEKIADGAVTSEQVANNTVTTEKIVDNAVTLPKIANDVKQYIAEQVGEESEDRASEITRVEGLIELERSDRDTEEEAIWRGINTKSTTVELNTLKLSTSILPLNGNYVYNGIPTHAVYIEVEVGQNDVCIVAFCIKHTDSEGLEDHRVLYYTKNGDNFVFTEEFSTNDADTDLRKYITQAVGAYIADGARPGLMSVIDKNNLDTAVSDISAIKDKISPAASSTNRLADKDYVDDKVATNTAVFQGTYNSLEEAEQQDLDADINDYIFIVGTDATGNTLYNRYKWGHHGWVFEYALNNSSFTAAQWAAINSGLNSNDRENINTALSNSIAAVETSGTALSQSNTALSRSGDARTIAERDAHIVANLEGAFSGSSPILDFSAETAYAIGNYCYKEGLLYRFTSAHSAGAWNASEVEQVNVLNTIKVFANVILGLDNIDTFNTSSTYTIGDYVLYNGKLYRFTSAHSAGTWNANEVVETDVFTEIKRFSETDYEEVRITLQTGDGQGTVSNIPVAVTVEGENGARNLTTDVNGTCVTQVQKGLQYIVAPADLSGNTYTSVLPQTKRASLPLRRINFVYYANPELYSEHVVVTVSFGDETLGTTDSIKVTTDGGETWQTRTLVSNVAEFDIALGSTYQIKFDEITGYFTPRTRTYTAEYHGTRPVNVTYNVPQDVRWLMRNGDIINLGDIQPDDYTNDEVFGVIIATSDLVENSSSIIIPTERLFGTRLSGNFLSTGGVVPPGMSYGQSLNEKVPESSNEKNIGRYNCDCILAYIKRNPSVTSGIAQLTYALNGGYPTFDISKNCSSGRYVLYNGAIYQTTKNHKANEAFNFNTDARLVFEEFSESEAYSIGDKVVYQDILYTFIANHSAGIWDASEVENAGYLMPDTGLADFTTHAFTPAYVQAKRYYDKRTNINSVTTEIWGKRPVNFETGRLWTSSLNSSSGDMGAAIFSNNGSISVCGLQMILEFIPVLKF